MFFRNILVCMTLILVVSIIGCGEEEAESPVTPTEESKEGVPLVSPAVVEFAKAPWDVNGDGQIDILDLVLVGQHFGEENVKAPEEEEAVEGIVGDTLSNGYYKVTVNQRSGTSFDVEIENIGNKQATYVGDFNFWVVDANSYVYPQGDRLGGGKGVILNVGQKTRQGVYFEAGTIRTSFGSMGYKVFPEGSKLIFQAYREVLPVAARVGEIVFLPVKEPIGRPIIFGDFPLFVIGINPSWEKFSGNDTLYLDFSKPVNVISLAGITITGGTVTATAVRDIIVEIQLENVAAGEQTLDISAVTDVAGNPITGDTEFTFTIKE